MTGEFPAAARATGSLALAGREFFEDGSPQGLQFAKARQVVLEFMIEQLRVLRTELVA